MSVAPIADLDPEKVELGRALFFDVRLSRDNSISCASCHDLERGGVDRMPVSLGVLGRPGAINAPTVYNSVYNFRQFWDGRAANLGEQAAGPVHNPVEMDSNWSQVLAKLGNDPRMVEAFNTAYPDGMTADNLVHAITEFERSLVTPSPFDRFLQGDTQAISAEAQHGYELFKRYGCVSCHQGRNMGGNMYQRLGVFGNYFEDRGNRTQTDLGRFNITGKESDRYVFKVPSLRNVFLTAPYFHDGSIGTPRDAVKTMARYQLGVEMPEADLDAILAFLDSLTGDTLGSQP